MTSVFFFETIMANAYVSELFGVKDKVVLISGGGAGIGKMIASSFVKAGAKVYISSRKADVLEKTARELTKEGPGVCIGIPADLSKKEGSLEILAQLTNKYNEKRLHVLVNNSGANWNAPLENYPDAALDNVRFFQLTYFNDAKVV